MSIPCSLVGEAVGPDANGDFKVTLRDARRGQFAVTVHQSSPAFRLLALPDGTKLIDTRTERGVVRMPSKNATQAELTLFAKLHGIDGIEQMNVGQIKAAIEEWAESIDLAVQTEPEKVAT